MYDTTPRFERFPGDTRGGPCNSDHDNCKGRVCEDPRGLDPLRVTVWGAPSFKITPSGYQIKVQGKATRIRVCPPSPLLDGEGKEVRLVGDGCDDRTYE